MKRFYGSRLVLLAACLAAMVTGALIAAERSSSAMADAATKFLGSLTPEQRQQAVFPFESEERLRWNFIPTETFPRKGLTVKEMTEAQRSRAHDLLKAGLSQRGYMTAAAIMDLETILGDLEDRARQGRAPASAGEAAGRGRGQTLVRDPVKYFFTVFGTPSKKATWGWRVEGHHVSLHFDVVNGTLVSSTPAFFGSNPAEVPDGPKKGLRLLADQEDSARALLMALDESQRAKAVIQAVAINEIVTTNKLDISPLSPVGITADALTPKQRDLLMKVIDVYASRMAGDIADDRLAKLKKAGLDKIAFAWAGEAERGKKHYYRIQGPTFLVEHDNSQNNGNHVHSVWRDFNGDFGRDLLREHVKSVAH
jgi:hypothetical protein